MGLYVAFWPAFNIVFLHFFVTEVAVNSFYISVAAMVEIERFSSYYTELARLLPHSSPESGLSLGSGSCDCSQDLLSMHTRTQVDSS